MAMRRRGYHETTEISAGAGVGFIVLVISLLAIIWFIAFTGGGTKLGNREEAVNSYDDAGFSVRLDGERLQILEGIGVFSGNGFTLEYSSELWSAGTAQTQSGETVPCLQHIPSEALLSQGGASGLQRLALEREDYVENYVENIYSLLCDKVERDPGSYVEPKTAFFEPLYNNMRYVSYAIYDASGAVSKYVYIIASADDGMVMSFVVNVVGTSSPSI
jgi:hypothetical protein